MGCSLCSRKGLRRQRRLRCGSRSHYSDCPRDRCTVLSILAAASVLPRRDSQNPFEAMRQMALIGKARREGGRGETFPPIEEFANFADSDTLQIRVGWKPHLPFKGAGEVVRAEAAERGKS